MVSRLFLLSLTLKSSVCALAEWTSCWSLAVQPSLLPAKSGVVQGACYE